MFRRTKLIRSFGVRNVGTVPTVFSMRVKSKDLGIFEILGQLSLSLDENTQKQIDVQFCPPINEIFHGELLIESKTAPHMMLPLSGRGITCALKHTSATDIIDFEQIPVEVPSQLRTKVINTGLADCVYSLEIIPESFSEVAKAWFHDKYNEDLRTKKLEIKGNEEKTVCVEIVPPKEMEDFSGHLILRPNRVGGVSVKENGLTLMVQGCGNATQLRLDYHKPINCGRIRAGEQRTIRRLIMNPADVPVDYKIDIIGDVRGWEISPTSGTIDAEDSEALVITFTCDPYMNESEDYNFNAHIINITANNHVDLKLVGTASRANPILDIVDNDVIAFGTVNTRESSYQYISIKNTGKGMLDCSFEIVGNKSFSLLSNPMSP